jgi:hypothetical protein
MHRSVDFLEKRALTDAAHLAQTLLSCSSEGLTMFKTTLLELIDAVSAFTVTEAELVATVVYMVNSGAVVLTGSFRGCTFDLDDPALAA